MGNDDRDAQLCPNSVACHEAGGLRVIGAAARTGEWKRVGAASDVPANGMKTFLVDGIGVLVVNTGDTFVALQPLCPHEAVPLDAGLVAGSTLTCLEHLWQFDLKTGAPLGEAEEGLQTYPLKNEEGQLYVAL